MRTSNPSRILSTNSSEVGGTNSTTSNMGPPQALNPLSRVMNGPVAILWDIENCPVPSDVRPEDVSGNIRMALRVHPVIKGAVTMFSAYGDFNAFPRRLREGCQRTGVKLVDVPNGRKDAADKAILIDMFLFALDNPPPSSVLLISGDVDFAPALHILGQRGYTIILVIPAGVGVSSALSNAGRFVWDWPSVVRGEGFVPSKAFMTHGRNLSGYFMGSHISDNPDSQNDEESIVYRGISRSEYTTRACCFNSSRIPTDFPRSSQLSEYCSNLVAMSCFPVSRSQTVPSGLSEVSMGPVVSDYNEAQDPTSWVQPGDINGLKGQLVKLLELSGGSMPLAHVSSEYQRIFGRPLHLDEYGVCKLIKLIGKMADTLTVEGKGNMKFVCLRSKSGLSIPSHIVKKDKKGKGTQEEIMIGCVNTVCSSDGSSDAEGANEQDDNNAETILWSAHRRYDCLESFRQELQELLVSCSCKIPLSTFEALYEQRYKKVLDYWSFGVTELEELINKVRDVVVLHEEEGSKKKFLVASCLSG